jgi:hypothetical protein
MIKDFIDLKSNFIVDILTMTSWLTSAIQSVRDKVRNSIK